MQLRSPAKINLYLRVRGKRADSFHELETLFERIAIFDRIRLTLTDGPVRLETRSPQIPSGPENLAYRAAMLLKQECGVRRGVLIRLEKNIPVSAGLGGGSSNAATVLLGLNRLWRTGLSRRRLSQLAARLGSDVPFFMMDSPFAVAAGRGEILSPLSVRSKPIWHCLIKPDFGVSTPEAYRRLNALPAPARRSLTLRKADAKMLLHSIHKGDSETLSKLLINSLEVTLNKRVTKILKIKEQLAEQGALGSLMSGSGSAVFGVFRDRAGAVRAARFFKRHPRWQVFVAKTF